MAKEGYSFQGNAENVYALGALLAAVNEKSPFWVRFHSCGARDRLLIMAL